MSDQSNKESTESPEPGGPVEGKQLGSIAKVLWGCIDFFVVMGMSVESRDDGRQLVLKYFGPSSPQAEQRLQRLREWGVWVLLGVPVGGVLGGWLVTQNPALFQAVTGVDSIELQQAIEWSCYAVATGLLVWLPFVLRGPSVSRSTEV